MKTPRPTLNLRMKFVLWTSVLIVAMIASTAWYLLYQEDRALKEERRLRGVSLINHLSELSREPLLLKDDLALHSLIGDIVRNEADVVYAYVGDIPGKRAFFTQSLGEEKGEFVQVITGLKTPGPGKVVHQASYPDVEDFSKLISVQGKPLGVSHVGISEKGIVMTLARTRNNVALFSLVAIVFFVSLSFALITLAVRPIRYLSSRARAVGKGDLETRISLMQKDELGELAESLDWMVRRLHHAQEARVAEEKLRKEMEIARQIQQRLLPRRFPKVPGFEFAALSEPAQEVGGDFYDIFAIDKTRLGFAIGDVAGKSVSGALLMVLVRTLLRAEAMDGKSPKNVLVKINHFLRDELAEERRRFVTLLYNVLDSSTRTVIYASAGHPAPLYVDGSARTIHEAPAKGMALGISDDSHFLKVLQEKTVTVAPGDGLFLYTDGLTEVNNMGKEEFGEEGLKGSLMRSMGRPAEDILSSISHDIVKYAGSAPIEDDVTMLLMRGM